jgi:putative ABC transport system permease protein
MINIFTVILMVFACAISAAVLFNMARISLSEKSWQLASLKILGYRNSEIFETLNLEIGLQVLLALAPGLLLGFGFSYLSTKMIHTDIFNFPLVIEIKTYAQAVVAIITLYFLTGIYLFKKTKSLNMTEALKERD